MIRSTNAVDPPRRRPATAIAAACTVLSALSCTCNDAPNRGTTLGELGKGTFSYRCIDATDGACPGEADKPAEFPAFIAVGGRFGLDYDAIADGQNVELDSPTSQVVLDRTEFVAIEPGWAAIVAWDGDTVFDLLHVEVVEPSTLTMEADRSLLELGDERTLAVTARTGEGVVTAGALPYEWSVDPPGVLELVGVEPTARMRAVAVGVGDAAVYVTTGQIGYLLDFEVLPGEVPGSTAETGPTGDTGSAP